MAFLFFSFFFQQQIYGREIILIQNEGGKENGKMLIEILQKKFNIPRVLIHYNEKLKCGVNLEAIIHLCLKKDGDLEVIKINKFAVNQVLEVFLEMEPKQ